ncbi:MAG: tyrosine-type recombinase/integrase [Alphaproteobacteria bacterium]|nr:tyrosine-type recombinase/integrase [Alphaproteobacteria bacterium]MBU4137819.1 tyrosine-type recombinase/integrase [Alphaproteobacteria bacterium]
MARLPKGIRRVIRRGPDGEIVSVYYYAWKGGPRLVGKPGSREFTASYAAALQGQKRKPADTLAGLALRYQASPEFAGLADSTQKEWRRRIATICADEGKLDIGGIPIEALNDPRVKADILAWRDQWQATPRGADFRMQVLSRILSWGQQRGLLTMNVVTGMGQLYRNNRADQVWTADELDRYVAASSSPEISFVAPLACLVGLRLDDLHTLLWSEVGDVAIVKVTRKGRGKRTAVIPLLAETRELLAQIRGQQVARNAELTARAGRLGRAPPSLPLTVLSNTFGRPWRYSGLVARVGETKAAATPPIEKHLHDARGTFATRLRKTGLTAPEIADALGWDEVRVERLLTVYVDRNTIVQGIAERIQRLEAEARRHANPARPVSDTVIEEEPLPRRQSAGVVISVDFRRGRMKAEVGRKPGQARMPTAPALGPPLGKEPAMRYPLIGLCAYLGNEGVERRSPWVSDEWLGAEIARDPWLFRTVVFEPGYFPLTDDATAVRWKIPDPIGRQMGEELRAAYA